MDVLFVVLLLECGGGRLYTTIIQGEEEKKSPVEASWVRHRPIMMIYFRVKIAGSLVHE